MSNQDVNALAVLDRAVQDVKQRFSRIMARTGEGDEKTKLEKSIKAHNNSIHSSIHGTPNEAGKNEALIFMNLVDNAKKFEHNKAKLEQRKEKLQEEGAYRKPLAGVVKNPFLRSFEARYGPPEKVSRIEGSTVVGQDGSKVDIKLVKAVPQETTETFSIEKERTKDEKRREKLFDIMEALREWVGSREVSLKAAAAHLAKTGPWELNGEQVDYKRLLRSQGLRVGHWGGLADAVRLFPQMFKLTRGALYVKKA